MRATPGIFNIPALKGQRAGKARFYGPHKLLAVYPVHTRFDAVAWAVSDAERLDVEVFDTEDAAIAYAVRRAAEAEAADPADHCAN